MQSTLTIAEIARIEELLSRLDPGVGVCSVVGCLHAHVTPALRVGVGALAA